MSERLMLAAILITFALSVGSPVQSLLTQLIIQFLMSGAIMWALHLIKKDFKQ